MKYLSLNIYTNISNSVVVFAAKCIIPSAQELMHFMSFLGWV